MPYRVVSVRPLEHLRLAVRFADGLSGDVVLKESHLYGLFEALKDPRLFNEVHCGQGFVEWPGEIDIAPDAMYNEIKARGIWVLQWERPFGARDPESRSASRSGVIAGTAVTAIPAEPSVQPLVSRTAEEPIVSLAAT